VEDLLSTRQQLPGASWRASPEHGVPLTSATQTVSRPPLCPSLRCTPGHPGECPRVSQVIRPGCARKCVPGCLRKCGGSACLEDEAPGG